MERQFRGDGGRLGVAFLTIASDGCLIYVLYNCLAHYGLGQYLCEDEIIENDILKGLTKKAFDMGYDEAKAFIYTELKSLTAQIKSVIF